MVQQYLEEGARPDVSFYSDEEGNNAISRIANECSFLTTCEVVPLFDFFEKHHYEKPFDIETMFGDLLGLIAHEEMYELLIKYENNDNLIN